MNQMDERGLSLAVIDPVAPGMIQNSFGDFLPLLFNTSLKAFKRLAHTVWHTWCGADRMRCYQLEKIYFNMPHSSPHQALTDLICVRGGKMHYRTD